MRREEINYNNNRNLELDDLDFNGKQGHVNGKSIFMSGSNYQNKYCYFYTYASFIQSKHFRITFVSSLSSLDFPSLTVTVVGPNKETFSM